MGQRHQLFVIAKIKNRYRGLAAVHHQWLYGNGPLKACINLIKIFSAPGNRKLLTHELNHAATLTEEVWGRASNSVPTKEDTPFPFVLTCLAIGASFSMDPGRASNTLIHPEDFNLRCDRGDNNDGITVLDISDPANVRHCFMQFPWGDLRDTLSLTPLSAEQYVTDYVPKTDETYIMLDCGSFVKALSSSKLIDIDTLMDAWPDVEWPETKENAEHQDEQEKPKEENSSQKNLVLSLEAMSLNNAFKTAAEHDDGAALLTDVEMLPKFESKLMDYLLTHPDIFKNTASGLTLLSRVVRAASDLDLSPFPSLTDADLLTVAEQASLYQSLRVLDLSGKPNITEDLLANLLPKCTQLQTLILFHTPQLGLNSVLRHLKQSTVQELFHTDHFQRAFDEKYFYLNKEEDTSAEFPCGRGTNFPVVQTWWFICEESDKASPNSNSVGDDNTEDGKPDTTDQSPPRFPWARSSLHGSFLRRGPLAVSLAMRDALLSPANVVRGASRVVEYIRSLDSSDMMRSQLGLAATGCAKALALLGEGGCDVRPIPAEQYMGGRRNFRFISPKTRRLQPGEWTVVLVTEYSSFLFETRHVPPRLRYAFVTRAAEGGDGVDGGDGALQVVDAHTFLRRVLGGTAESDGEALKQATALWDKVLTLWLPKPEVCSEEEVREMLKADLGWFEPSKAKEEDE